MLARLGLTVVAAAALLALTAAATASAAIRGSVVRLSDGAPVAGAAVTAAGPGQTPVTAATGADGTFAVDVAGSGPFGVSVRAAGLAAQSVGGAGPNSALAPFALAPATFLPLPLDVGPTNFMAADAASGIFYALVSPELYRTVDYGGTWQPVTASYDDADSGLRNTNSRNLLAVSSVSGELAVATDGPIVSYSKDYGMTWRRVGGDLQVGAWAPRRDPLFFWGHAAPGAPSVLLLADPQSDGSWNVWRADMSASEPVWVKDPSDPFGTGSEVAQADSRTGSFIGRVSAAGGLSFAPLTASGAIAFGPEEATGLPSPPELLQLGGSKEDATPPDAVLVAGGATPRAQMLTKAAGVATFSGASSSTATPLSNDCTNPGGLARSLSSVAPTSGGANGAGSIERCWLKKDGSGPLEFLTDGAGGVSNRAYDADWGNGNFVAFLSGFTFGGANLGPLKYSRLSPGGGPLVEIEPGTGGTDPESGGYSVRGLTTAPVGDTAYGPEGASQQAYALLTDSIASADGGATVVPVLPRGAEWSNAVEWWRGASGDWLLFGHEGRCDQQGRSMLSAVRNWNGTATLAGPNVGGSTCADLGGPTNADVSTGPPYGVKSLEPVPGSDTVFVGLGSFDHTDSHHLYRGTLAGEPPSLSNVVSIDDLAGVSLSNSPTAMAYCPSLGGDSDVLLVALGTLYEHGLDVPGGLLRVTGATGPSPVAGYVDSIPHDGLVAGLEDVRADCGSGVVYAGGYNGIQGVHPGAGGATGFFKSTDGGRTFTRITIAGVTTPVIGEITAIGLNPADPNDVKVAAETTGTIAHSIDGGATWTIVNDPQVSRTNRVNDLEYPLAAGAARFASPPVGRAAALGALSPLLGTTGGAFRGDIAATHGVIGVRIATAGVPLGTRITTLGSDSHPVALPPRPGSVGATLFRRSNGLAVSFESRGSWSTPTSVPGTTAADGFPAVATDGGGSLAVAFARSSKARGIYATGMQPNGSWTGAQRLTRKAGDTLPAIAVAGGRVHVVFLRTRGAKRGVFHIVSSRTGFLRPRRVPGTARADARPARGGPTLVSDGTRAHLSFASAGRRPGIRYASVRGRRWSALERVTKGKRDAQPDIAIGRNAIRHIVFRRARGLFVLRGGRRWSTARIRGTAAGDSAPDLVANGAELTLVFVRTGSAPGIYRAQSTTRGRFRRAPRRVSSAAADRNPSVARDAGTGTTLIVFERR